MENWSLEMKEWGTTCYRTIYSGVAETGLE